MKHKVERSIDGSRDWLVLDPHGNVVYATTVWEWAIDDAIVRYNVLMFDAMVTLAFRP